MNICPKCKSKNIKSLTNVDFTVVAFGANATFKCLDCGFEGERGKKRKIPRKARVYEGVDELYCAYNGFCPYQWHIERHDGEGETGYIPICRYPQRLRIDEILIKAYKNFKSIEKTCENETEDQSQD